MVPSQAGLAVPRIPVVLPRSQAAGRNQAVAPPVDRMREEEDHRVDRSQAVGHWVDRMREEDRIHLEVEDRNPAVGRNHPLHPEAARSLEDLRLAQAPARTARSAHHFHRRLDSQNPPAKDATKLLRSAEREGDRLRLLVWSQVQ